MCKNFINFFFNIHKTKQQIKSITFWLNIVPQRFFFLEEVQNEQTNVSIWNWQEKSKTVIKKERKRNLKGMWNIVEPIRKWEGIIYMVVN